MNYIQLDVISLVMGYLCGVFFCWTLCELIYGNKHD